MIKAKKNKKALFAVGGILAVALIGGTIAYNYTNYSFNNIFGVGEFQSEISEVFDSPTNWKPCDETEKLFTIKNTGNVDAKVRIEMNQQWLSSDGQELPLVTNNMTVAQITFDNPSDWTLTDGYYYLNDDLGADESVNFTRSVTFNCAADFGKNIMVDGDGIATETPDNPYNGASYHLSFTAQLLQADANIAWDDAFGYKEPRTFALLAPSFDAAFRNVTNSRTLTAFKRSKTLPQSFTADMNQTDVSDSTESTPIYLWYSPSDTTIYWYSTADAVTVHAADASLLSGAFALKFFNGKMDDISGFEYFDMRNLMTIAGFFGSSNMPDDMSYLSHWNLSNIRSWGGALSGMKDEWMSAVEHWDVSGATSMAGLMSGTVSDLSMLKNWNVSNVTNMGGAFSGLANLTSLRGLESWDVHNVTSFSGMFQNETSLTDISAISGWNPAAATNLNEMFKGDTSLTNASPLDSWGAKFSGTPTKTDMFASSGVTRYPSWY